MSDNLLCILCGEELIPYKKNFKRKCSICGNRFPCEARCTNKHRVCPSCLSEKLAALAEEAPIIEAEETAEAVPVCCELAAEEPVELMSEMESGITSDRGGNGNEAAEIIPEPADKTSDTRMTEEYEAFMKEQFEKNLNGEN